MKNTNLGTADNPILITPDNIVEVFADIMQYADETMQLYKTNGEEDNKDCKIQKKDKQDEI